tara:strand:+ start:631 stop:942 length:312 start_codon:yes stop_codon:yes gene_type:complete
MISMSDNKAIQSNPNDRMENTSLHFEIEYMKEEKKEAMLQKLKRIQKKIDIKTSSLNELHKEKKSVIVFCYSNGMSAISIAQALNMTRQRVYKILEENKEEEE